MTGRILVVDDEIHMLKLLERIITLKTDHQVKICNSSLEVKEILAEEQFDVIITDLKMPGLNGIELLEWIKENQRSEEVILITAFATADSANKAYTNGVFDYIVKPFKKERIILTVNRAIELQNLRRESKDLYEIKPYDKAQKRFLNAYLIRLAESTANDLQEMVDKSGLEIEIIADFLNKQISNS